MLGFNDRRPTEAVPKVNLRSKAALEDHMAGHHGTDVGAWDNSELRERHMYLHTDDFAVTPKPHTHESARFPNGDA